MSVRARIAKLEALAQQIGDGRRVASADATDRVTMLLARLKPTVERGAPVEYGRCSVAELWALARLYRDAGRPLPPGLKGAIAARSLLAAAGSVLEGVL